MNGTVYCAGPLFDTKQREEMASIAEALERGGFKVFLPQRDGICFQDAIDYAQTVEADYSAACAKLKLLIFALDVHQVMEECDALVLNLNGELPDGGSVAEAAMAWAAGKPVVLYSKHADPAITGSGNPLIAGLGEFTLVAEGDSLPRAVEAALQRQRGPRRELAAHVRDVAELGSAVAKALRSGGRGEETWRQLLTLASQRR